ncbi:MAG TPA: DUF1175 family protein [Vicinamibacterales bacterium]
MRRTASLLLVLAAVVLPLTSADLSAQLRLSDAGDRQALRSWFVLLVDAAFYAPPPDVTDCAALVRYGLRESLRPHTPEWLRRAGLPAAPGFPDVRERPAGRDGMLPIFRVSSRPDDLAEFADARTIIRWNTWHVSRDVSVARPGDLLYYRQPSQRQPDHLMVVVGPSQFDRSAPDFVVYHTGPDGDDPGEIRKVRLADLLRHPSPRWRPVPSNEAFVGVFRLVSFP